MTTCPGPRGNRPGMRRRRAAARKGPPRARLSLLFFRGAKEAQRGETREADRWGSGSWRREAESGVRPPGSRGRGGGACRAEPSESRGGKTQPGEEGSAISASPRARAAKACSRGRTRLGPGWDPAATPAATLAEISAGTPATTRLRSQLRPRPRPRPQLQPRPWPQPRLRPPPRPGCPRAASLEVFWHFQSGLSAPRCFRCGRLCRPTSWASCIPQDSLPPSLPSGATLDWSRAAWVALGL